MKCLSKVRIDLATTILHLAAIKTIAAILHLEVMENMAEYGAMLS
jgi:hypothetical protein